MEEDTVLRVKGDSSATSLASAISHGIYDGKKVVLRAIGAGAVNQAVKAVAIAQSYVGARGLTLSMRPGFTDVYMPDLDAPGKTVRTTAMVFRVLTNER
jgi:stage V sporulation protein S